jgi:hypothetical protein
VVARVLLVQGHEGCSDALAFTTFQPLQQPIHLLIHFRFELGNEVLLGRRVTRGFASQRRPICRSACRRILPGATFLVLSAAAARARTVSINGAHKAKVAERWRRWQGYRKCISVFVVRCQTLWVGLMAEAC